MHSKDTNELVCKFITLAGWSTKVSPTNTGHAMTQLKLPGKVGRNFYCL